MSGSKRTAGVLRAVGAAAVVLMGVAACGVADDLGTTVPPPTVDEAREASSQLARAAEAQGICYGWQLTSGTDRSVVSQGSNLGADVPVGSDPTRCPEFVEVKASVVYTAESSEAEDSASLAVATSPGLRVDGDLVTGLNRLGLNEQSFIDEPGWAVCRSALSLPLLLAENGGASPAPVPTAATSPAPLAGAGNDFWRDRWAFVLAAIGLVVGGLLLVLIGWRERRRQQGRIRPIANPLNRPPPRTAPPRPMGPTAPTDPPDPPDSPGPPDPPGPPGPSGPPRGTP